MDNSDSSNKDFLSNDFVRFDDQSLADFLYQNEKIDAARFSKSYPYQLIMFEEGSNSALFTFTLPIPPQDLTVNMPFATTVQATLGGIVEQHGGVPFKDIVFSGTTGITPIKNTATNTLSSLDSNQAVRTSEAIFAGTATAAVRTITTGQQLLGITKNNINNKTLTKDVKDQNSIVDTSTGYYQFKLLERFLESYQLLKKKTLTGVQIGSKTIKNTKNLRLAFLMWKDESAYVCAGVNFGLKRNVQSPMKYNYSLSLKAWKRINIKDLGQKSENSLKPSEIRDPNYFTNYLSKIYEARDVLDSLDQLIEAAVLDPGQRLKEIVRITGLFLNSAYTISDLPSTLQLNVIDSLVQNWQYVSKQYNALIGKPVPTVLIAGRHKLLDLSTHSAQPVNSALLQVPTNIYSDRDIRDILNTVRPESIPLPLILQKQINAEKDKANGLTRLDFANMREEVVNYSNNFADAVGASSDVFDTVYNRQNTNSTKIPTDEDYQILFSLNNVITVLGHLAANAKDTQRSLTTMEYVAGLAQRSGIAFRVPKSKYPIPFPYGFTLEKLAENYLKDANRWQEIATLNGLRSPYVDETGFTLTFQTNGADNYLYVNDASNLYIGQTIYISSNRILRNKRHIVDIKQIYPGYIEITVDGLDNLDAYKTIDSAKLEAFLPNTTNSQQLIYLPSDRDPVAQPETSAIPGVDQFDPLLQVSGIDLLLKDDGDLAITPDGDCKLAFGLQNIVQTVKIALTTPQGSLIQHPGFGFDIPVGSSTADVDANVILDSAKTFFNSDPSFEGIVSASVIKNGPVATITLVLKVKGLSQYIPVSLNLTR